MADVKKEQKQETKIKKILRLVGDVIFGIYMVFMIAFAISNIVAVKNGGIPSVFGTGYMNVLTDSMVGSNEDSFNPGDLVVVKTLKNGSTSLQVGDVASFKYKDLNDDGVVDIVSHRIIKVNNTGSNVVYYLTGDNQLDTYGIDYKNLTEADITTLDNAKQLQVVEAAGILAVYKSKIVGFGKVINWCQGRVGFFVIVVVPTILFLIVELISFIKTYADVKAEKIRAEATVSEEDRAKEREELKKQLLAELKAEAMKEAAASQSAELAAEEPAAEEPKTEE